MNDLHEILQRRMTVRRDMMEGKSARGQRHAGQSSTYDCESRSHARALVEQLLDLQDRTHHCARVLIDGCKVTLETWTPNQGITELDEEFAAEAGLLFEDARHWA